MGCVYIIKNTINNLIYIGRTERDYKLRLQEHKNDFKKIKHNPLCDAINKYGLKNFTIEPLFESNNSEELAQKEKEFVESYNSCNPEIGYNQVKGGKGRPTVNLDEKEVIQYYLYEGDYSLQKTSRKYKINYKTLQKILRKNGIEPMTLNEYRAYARTKKVKQIDPVTNEVICIYNSLTEAALPFGSNNKNNIADAIHGRHKTAYGYKWEQII